MKPMSKYIVLLALLAIALSGAWFLTNTASPIITSKGRVVVLGEGLLALYVEMENTGQADVITRIEADGDARTSFMGVPKGYKPVLPQDSKASFSSDGAHVMVRTGGARPTEGSFMTFTIHFENTGTVPLRAIVSDMGTTMQESEGSDMAKINHAMHGGQAVDVKSTDAAPSVKLVVDSNPNGGVDIVVETENFKFVEPEQDPAAHVDGEGHGHLYLNGLKIGRLYAPKATIGDLPEGKHRFRVSLNTNDHRVYAVAGSPVQSDVEFEVTK